MSRNGVNWSRTDRRLLATAFPPWSTRPGTIPPVRFWWAIGQSCWSESAIRHRPPPLQASRSRHGSPIRHVALVYPAAAAVGALMLFDPEGGRRY